NGGDDLIAGDHLSVVDSVAGFGDDDSIDGGSGNDCIAGDSFSVDTGYNDAAHTYGGDDTIAGGSGNDTIYGDGVSFGNTDYSNFNEYAYGGDDIITGGGGSDLLYGDWTTITAGNPLIAGGEDTFVYLSTSDGGDTIGDFQPGIDTIDVSAIDSGDGGVGDFSFNGTTPTGHGIWYTEGSGN